MSMLSINKMFVLLLSLNIILQVRTFEYADLAARAVFPPVLDDQNKQEQPIGHKKPLGTQRAPEAPVKEYTKILTADEFWENHVKPHTPLVYRGVIKDSPAVSLWDDKYLAEHYGDLDVLVEHKREDRSSTSGRMTIKDFVTHYKNDDLYVVTMFPTEMMHQVRAINSVLCGTFKNYTHESNMWISSGGTRSVVHYDADHNLHCIIDGRKDFIMIPNTLKTKTNLYFKQKDPSVGSGFSFLDPDSIDMKKFPRIAKVPWTWATLYPGDCIFIPSVYIHQVRGYGRTIAVTTLFTADLNNNFNSSDCTDEIMTKNFTMADIDFLWTYKKGDSTIDMGYMNTEIVKKELTNEVKSENNGFSTDGKMNMKQFIYFSGVFSPYGRNKTLVSRVWKETFGLNESDYLDIEKIKALTLEQLRIYCRVIETPHGVVTNGSEPVFVRPGERHKWEIEHPDNKEEQEEDEEELQRITSRDPMLEHLNDEEREEYIKKRQAEKQKFGIKYSLEEEMLDKHQMSEEKKILMELSWRYEDIPKQYRNSIRKGRIPKEFRDEFVESLPESIVQKYGKYFKKFLIPKTMMRALLSSGGDDYRMKALKELTGKEDADIGEDVDDEEDDDNEEEKHVDGNEREEQEKQDATGQKKEKKIEL